MVRFCYSDFSLGEHYTGGLGHWLTLTSCSDLTLCVLSACEGLDLALGMGTKARRMDLKVQIF